MKELAPAADINLYLARESTELGNDIAGQIIQRTFSIGVLTP
jgi:hypothetical protein